MCPGQDARTAITYHFREAIMVVRERPQHGRELADSQRTPPTAQPCGKEKSKLRQLLQVNEYLAVFAETKVEMLL